MDVAEANFAPGDFRFASGAELPSLRLHYRTLGSPRRDDGERITNAALLLHGTTGDGSQFLHSSLADQLFGPGQPLDVAEHFVVLPDAIGHGGSSKPSDGLRTRFPQYTYGDIVQAQHRLVTEHLGITTLRLVGGVSMGGMQVWMWAERYPEAMRALLPVASLPEPVRGRNLLWRRLLVDTIRSDPGYRDGDYDSQPGGLGTAMNVFTLMTSGVGALEEELDGIPAADAKVADTAKAALSGKDANDIVYAFVASKDYDPSGDLEAIAAPLVAVNFADDELNPAELGVLDRGIRRVRDGRAVLVPRGPKSKGHQTLQVAELWAPHLRDLLERTR